MSVDMEMLKANLDDAFEKIKPSYGKDLVLVIGKTGAGKSTTVNYLLHFPLKKGKGGKAYPVDPSSVPPAKMGDTAEAVTSIPVAYTSKDGHNYCDCPGFQDNRGSEMRVCVSLATEAVVHRSKSIRSIIAVIDWHSIEAGRAEGFKEIAHILGSLLKGDFDPARSILFIFTKARLDEVDNDYLYEKISDVIKTLTKKLDQLNARASKDGGGFNTMLSTQNHTGDDTEATENDTDSLAKALWVLKLMQANKRNLLLIDIFDNGNSRQEILARLRDMREIPKQTFHFSEADSVRRVFQAAVTREMVEGLQAMKRHFGFPRELEQDEHKLNETLASVEDYKSQITDLESGRIFKGEQDPIVISSKAKIDQNLNAIASKQRVVASSTSEKEQMQHELWGLDSADEVDYWGSFFKKNRSSEVGGAMSTPYDKAAATHNDGIFVGALLLAPVILPIAALVGGFSRIEHKFEYMGAPFTKIKEECKNTGKIKRLKEDYQGGIYIGKYESNRGSTPDVTVIISGEKRNKPDNKTRIKQLNTQIKEVITKIQDNQRDIIQLEQANIKLKSLIDDFLRGDKKNIKHKKAELESLMKSAIEHSVELQKILNEKKIYAAQLSQDLENKKVFYNIIQDISGFMSFNTENYPEITQEFLQEYPKLKGGNEKTFSLGTGRAEFFSPPPKTPVRPLPKAPVQAETPSSNPNASVQRGSVGALRANFQTMQVTTDNQHIQSASFNNASPTRKFGPGK